METTYRLLGVNSDHDTCTACGRTGLKRVAWLVALDADGNEDGDAAAFGTDCAGKVLLGAKSRKNTEAITVAGRIIDTARRWLTAGHDADKVADAIWNRYGYQTEARDGAVLVRSMGTTHEVRAA